MPYKKCLIPNCSFKGDNKLYSFPMDKRLAEAWHDILVSKFPGIKISGVKKFYQQICELHFEDIYKKFGRRMVNAIPTLFTQEEIRVGKPSKPINIVFEGFYEQNPYPELRLAVTRKRPVDTTSLTAKSCAPMHVVHDHGYYARTKRIKICFDECGLHGLDYSPLTAPQPMTTMTAQPSHSAAPPEHNLRRLECVAHAAPAPMAATATVTATATTTATATVTATATTTTTTIVSQEHDSHELDSVMHTTQVRTKMAQPAPLGNHKGSQGLKSRARIVRSQSDLTPNCRKMYTKCVNIIKSKRRLEFSFTKRLKKALDLSQEHSFASAIESLPPHRRTFINMQVSLANKHAKRRRFSIHEKLLSLAVLKNSPKSYKLLQKLFILPSRKTLSIFTQDFLINPGLNVNILAQLKEMVQTWDAKKRICAITFDEISLTSHLTFVEKSDEIIGFVNYGSENKYQLCDHALVFMLRGVISSWRQLIAFYFCEGSTPAADLKSILRNVVEAVSQTGLIPKILLCDQGSTFQSCIKSFREDTKRAQLLNDASSEPKENEININGHAMYVMFDPPHLIKGIRNNFLNKDLVFNGKTAKWSDIVEIYKADCQLGDIRMLHKLSDEHVFPEKIKKMSVKHCTQTLSERTSAMLNYTSRYETHADGRPVSKSMRDTAEAVLFFDRLFDSVNGSRNSSSPGKMRGPVKLVKGESKHVAFWKDAIRVLENTHYRDANSGNIKNVPSIKNWIITLKSFIDIWLFLQNFDVSFFYTRNLNQDPLENFFGRIRAINHRNNNPDAHTFICSFKSLLITNNLGPQSPHSNCEDDMGRLLLTLNKDLDSTQIFSNSASQSSAAAKEPTCLQVVPLRVERPLSPAAPGGTAERLFRQARMEKTNVHASAYTAGFISRRLVAKFKCRQCKQTFLTQNPSDIHTWTSQRERRSLKGRNLSYPNSKFVILFRDLVKTCNNYLDNYAHRPNVTKNIRTEFLKTTNVEWLGCAAHHKDVLDLFIRWSCRVQIHNFCNTLNKILKGSHSESPTNFNLKLYNLAFKKYKSSRGSRATK